MSDMFALIYFFCFLKVATLDFLHYSQPYFDYPVATYIHGKT